MNAPVALDEIRVFLPDISEGEHALRSKMRSYRNVASKMTSGTKSDTARQLAWIVSDYATHWLYAPASKAEIEDMNLLLSRLLKTAMHAQNVDEFGPGEIPEKSGSNV